jgi:hypothetical protein
MLMGSLYSAASPDAEELIPSGRLSKWLHVKSLASPQPDIRHTAKPEDTHFTILSFEPGSSFVDFNICTEVKKERGILVRNVPRSI